MCRQEAQKHKNKNCFQNAKRKKMTFLLFKPIDKKYILRHHCRVNLEILHVFFMSCLHFIGE